MVKTLKMSMPASAGGETKNPARSGVACCAVVVWVDSNFDLNILIKKEFSEFEL
jgi:hypothetical protein